LAEFLTEPALTARCAHVRRIRVETIRLPWLIVVYRGLPIGVRLGFYFITLSRTGRCVNAAFNALWAGNDLLVKLCIG
jgi:hypothetical protein